jgi:hypothetical protein
MTTSVVLVPTTAALGLCGHCQADLAPGHRCIPAIVAAPDLAPHRACTQCPKVVGYHYGSRPVMCAGQLFGSIECATAWVEAPRVTVAVENAFMVPVVRDKHGGQWLPCDAPDDGGGQYAAGSAYYGRRPSRRAGAR